MKDHPDNLVRFMEWMLTTLEDLAPSEAGMAKPSDLEFSHERASTVATVIRYYLLQYGESLRKRGPGSVSQVEMLSKLNEALSANLDFGSVYEKKYKKSILKAPESLGEENVVVYIADEEIDSQKLDVLLKSIDDFMEACGFELKGSGKPVLGSFFQRAVFKVKKLFSSKEARLLLEEGKVALRVRILSKPSAEATLALSQAVSNSVSALSCFDSGVIKIGDLLVIKTTVDCRPVIFAEVVSASLERYLDENPQYLRNPEALLGALKIRQEGFGNEEPPSLGEQEVN